MSPAQVLADPLALDVWSDVYALGVVLYELLAGRLPYDADRKKLHEAGHVICEGEPARLSSTDRTFRGDIETIVAKAPEKEKSRRYGSAAELANDIRRHLDHHPIVARPATTVYQLQKFVMRHTALVAGIAAAFVLLALRRPLCCPPCAGDTRRRSRGSSRATELGFSSFAPFGTPVCHTSVAAFRHADQDETNDDRWNTVVSGARAA